MRFFSKIVFIANLCFIVSAILRIVELGHPKGNAIIPLQAVEGTIVTIGFIMAIILNAIFFITIIIRKSYRFINPISPYILWFNIALLPIECWYFFIKA